MIIYLSQNVCIHRAFIFLKFAFVSTIPSRITRRKTRQQIWDRYQAVQMGTLLFYNSTTHFWSWAFIYSVEYFTATQLSVVIPWEKARSLLYKHNLTNSFAKNFCMKKRKLAWNDFAIAKLTSWFSAICTKTHTYTYLCMHLCVCVWVCDNFVCALVFVFTHPLPIYTYEL